MLQPEVIGLVVARLVARGEDRRELVERELAVGYRIARRAIGAHEGLRIVGLGLQPTDIDAALRDRHRSGQRGAGDEAAAEHLTHVAYLMQICADEARTHRVVVRRKRGRGYRVGLERGEGGL